MNNDQDNQDLVPDDGPDDFSVAAAEGDHERRLHLQAFDYWHDLKSDRGFPLFAELRADALAPFKANSLLFEFIPAGTAVRFVGGNLGELVGPDMKVGSYLGDFPDAPFAQALVEQFTEEEVRARAVEFEFLEEELNCRGIMLPFSRDGSGAHFVMVVVSFSSVVPAHADDIDNADDAETIAQQEAEQLEATGVDSPADSQEQNGEADEAPVAEVPDVENPDAEADEADLAILNGLLGAARQAAGSVISMDSGNRNSLYDALASALALYEGGQENRPAYEALLGQAGLREQTRAPFTPSLKLVFGADYDKTRLTEYSAALAYAVRNGKTSSDVADFLKAMPGGIKGCVQEERAFKRAQAGTSANNRQKEAEEKVRHLKKVPLKDINPDDEFSLILVRRKDGGGVEALGCPEVSRTTLDTAIRQLASRKE